MCIPFCWSEQRHTLAHTHAEYCSEAGEKPCFTTTNGFNNVCLYEFVSERGTPKQFAEIAGSCWENTLTHTRTCTHAHTGAFEQPDVAVWQVVSISAPKTG